MVGGAFWSASSSASGVGDGGRDGSGGGASVDAVTNKQNGQTPAYTSCVNGNKDCLELLCKHKADLNKATTKVRSSQQCRKGFLVFCLGPVSFFPLVLVVCFNYFFYFYFFEYVVCVWLFFICGGLIFFFHIYIFLLFVCLFVLCM